jgi:hypothetical protein
MPRPSKTAQQETKIEFVRAADFKSYYANNSGVHVTQWDFALRFGRLLDPSDGITRVEQHLEVSLSPQHMKALISMLQHQLRGYEEKFGAIPDAAPSATKVH